MTKLNTTYEVFPHPHLPCIMMKWKGYSESPEFKKGTEKMLELLKQHQFNKVIADVKEMKQISQEDQHWVINDFLPRAINDGFRVMAFINSDDYYNRITIENMAYRIDLKNMNFGFFDTLPAAEKWIERTDFYPPSFNVLYDAEIEAIILEWHGVIKGKEFQEGTLAMLSLLKEKGLSKAIINLDDVPYSVDLETHNWIKNIFLPEAIKAGFRTCAFINPGIYNSLSIYNIVYNLKPGTINVEVFDSLVEAKDWIKKV